MAHNFVNPIEITDSTDTTKKINFDPSGATTDTSATISTEQVADRTYSIPDSGANASFVMTEGSQTINGTTTFNGSLLIKESSGSDTITIQAPALAASYSLTLPVDDGTSNNQALTTDGNGVLSWQSFLPAGMLLPFAGSSTPSGFLLCDGSEVSQATYANLFAAIGTTWNTGGEGAGNFRLPNLSRRTLVGSGGAGSGTLGNAVGNTGGEENHTLITAELPTHTHGTGTLANTTSSISGTVGGSDGTHTHAVNDPGHSHLVYLQEDDGGGAGRGVQFGANNTKGTVVQNGQAPFPGTDPTGVTVTSTNSGHSHAHSLTAAAQTISGSTGSAGSDAAHNNIQPSAIVTYVIKY